jgi:NADPH-dependent 2,4-dienoyl-CoA reductase/sulfur reductase-like enzyme
LCVRIIPPAFLPLGDILHLSAAVKSDVNIPVIASGKTKDPQMAENALREGKTDFVGIGRCLIADPEWAKKSAEGKIEDIRKCTGCNTYCLYERSWLGRPLRCQVNPTVGREAELEIKCSSKPKEVLVIGGGPAGMEAARIAAIKGHKVTILEKEPELGGQLRAAIVPPHKEINYALEFLTTEMKLRGVTVELNTIATPEMIQKRSADAIVVATGARHKLLNIPGLDKGIVHTAFDVLLGKRKLAGKKVVIVGGSMIGCETAEYLAESQEKEIFIIEMLSEIAQDIEAFYTRPALLERIASLGITTILSTKPTRITDGIITCIDSRGKQFDVQCDEIVIAVGMEARNELVKELEISKQNLICIGDCVEPRKLRDAILEGFLAGFSI